MTNAQAQIELTKTNTAIETKVVELANELGQHNKSCVMNDLQLLWDKSKMDHTLRSFL